MRIVYILQVAEDGLTLGLCEDPGLNVRPNNQMGQALTSFISAQSNSYVIYLNPHCSPCYS